MKKIAAGMAAGVGVGIGLLSIGIRTFGAYGYSPRIEDGIWFLLLAILITLIWKDRP